MDKELKSLTKKLIGHQAQLGHLKKLKEDYQLPHCWIFCGPSGVGKKLLALVTAQILVCEKGSGCGECGPCVRVFNRQSESLLLIEPDGDSIKVEQAHEVLRFMGLKTLGQAQIVIIDEADRLNPQAANTLLKSIEEPPANNYIFLITSNLSAVLPTIRSRGQILRFEPLTNNELKTITGAPMSAIHMAQGRVDLAQLYSERGDELAERSEELLRVIREKDYLHLSESLTDRSALIETFQYCQHRLRGVVSREDMNLNLSPEQALKLWSLAFQAESDLKNHVDSKLTVDAFYIKSQEVLHS